MTGRILIPVGEAVELPEEEAWRALFNDFGVLEDLPTEPMPLTLELLPEEEFTKRAAAALRRHPRRTRS